MNNCEVETEKEETENMIDKIYSIREEKIGIVDEKLKNKLHDISLEEIKRQIDENIENNQKKGLINDSIDMLIENYEIKMAFFIKEGYKQGFKDAFKLFNECVEK